MVVLLINLFFRKFNVINEKLRLILYNFNLFFFRKVIKIILNIIIKFFYLRKNMS